MRSEQFMGMLFLKILFGHVVGDFFLQHGLMANNKFAPGRRGHVWCTLHVIAYTLVVCTIAGNLSLPFLFFVSAPHWILDRYSLAFHWMRLLGRGSLMKSTEPLQASFGAIIYVVIDQTMHLACLYVVCQLISWGG